ncbi:MAG: hydroxymethylbilane synthase [Balneolales bacterium]|nr:hydroxymethylbilane synthase [Balneolales bacterium]
MGAKTIRIGTRDSILATWQAEHVAAGLKQHGYKSELVFIKTEGDQVLDTPLPMLGGKGVFTKALDDALLRGEVDIAVHSFKDIPTLTPEGLAVIAILERDDPRDVLVARKDADFLHDESYEAVIATSSHRRGGQWLGKFPKHLLTDIRGNVHTRLRKLNENKWDGAIFAAAGLKRVGLDGNISAYLEWMVPAPAQGAVAVMARDNRPDLNRALGPLHHSSTALCTRTERRFLQVLEGGCSAPLGAFAQMYGSELQLKAVLTSLDGSLREEISMNMPVEHAASLGDRAAEAMMARETVMDILAEIRKDLE